MYFPQLRVSIFLSLFRHSRCLCVCRARFVKRSEKREIEKEIDVYLFVIQTIFDGNKPSRKYEKWTFSFRFSPISMAASSILLWFFKLSTLIFLLLSKSTNENKFKPNQKLATLPLPAFQPFHIQWMCNIHSRIVKIEQR